MPRKKLDRMSDSSMTFLPVVSSDYTFEQAQEEIYDAARDDIRDHRCPCCGQRTRVYKTRPDLKSLVVLVDAAVEYRHTRDWVDISGQHRTIGNVLLWSHWGFIEVNEELDRGAGHKWAKVPRLIKPTQAAYDWLTEETDVNAFLYVFDQKPVAVTDRMVGFKEFAGKKYHNLKRKLSELPQVVRPKKVIKLKKKGLRLKPKVE